MWTAGRTSWEGTGPDRRHPPRPIVILNAVKDLPATDPERCFTSFSMTVVDSRGQPRAVAPLPLTTQSPPNCHPERSEGSSGCLPREMLHFVQHDRDGQTGVTPCGHRHSSCPPYPVPIVILNEVKDPPAASPERCFTSFSMTGMDRRERPRVVIATLLARLIPSQLSS